MRKAKKLLKLLLPFHSTILISILLFSCTPVKKSIIIDLNYIPAKDLFFVKVEEGFCRKYSAIVFNGEKIISQKDNIEGNFFFKRQFLIGSDKISLYCDDKLIKNIPIPDSQYATIIGIITGTENINEIVKKERHLYSNLKFYKTFKDNVLKDYRYLNNSLKIINYFPLDYQFDLCYEGYKKYNGDEIIKYIIDRRVEFFSLPKFEEFFDFVLKNGKIRHQNELINAIYERLTQRFVKILLPNIEIRQELHDNFFRALEQGTPDNYYDVLSEYVVEKINKKEFNTFVDRGVSILLKYKNWTKNKVLIEKILMTGRYDSDVYEYLKYNVDESDGKIIAKFYKDNLNRIGNVHRFKVFVLLEKYFNDDYKFYLESMHILPEHQDYVIEKLSKLDFHNDKKVIEILIRSAKQRPIPNFIFEYLQKADDNTKKQLLEQIFIEPIIQIEVLDLMKEYDFKLFYKKISDILEKENHALWDLVLDKIEEIKEIDADYLIKYWYNIKEKRKKIKLLKILLKKGEKGQMFVLNKIINDTEIEKGEIIGDFATYANDNLIYDYWKIINKNDSELLTKFIRGIRDRGRPTLCEDLLKLIVEHNDKNVKIQSIYAHIYCCKDEYLENFDSLYNKVNIDIQRELFEGVRDLMEIKPELSKEVKEKLNVYRKQIRDERIIETIDNILIKD